MEAEILPLEHEGVVYPDVPADRVEAIITRRVHRTVGAAPLISDIDDDGTGAALWDPTWIRGRVEEGTRFAVRVLRLGCGAHDQVAGTMATRLKQVTWDLRRIVVDDAGTELAAPVERHVLPFLQPKYPPGTTEQPIDYFGLGGIRSRVVRPASFESAIFSDHAKLKARVRNMNAVTPPTATIIVEAEIVVAIWRLERGEAPPGD